MSILDKIAFECWLSSNFTNNVDLGQNLQIFPFWWKISLLVTIYENLDVGQSLWKSRFWSKLSENLDLGQHLRKISILVKIFGKIFPKSLFWWKFPKMSILVKICKYVDFGE